MVSIATGKENNTTETIAYLELMHSTILSFSLQLSTAVYTM